MEEITTGEIVFFLDGEKYTTEILRGNAEVAGVAITFEEFTDTNATRISQVKIDCGEKEVLLHSLVLTMPQYYEETGRILVNGFQSWTDSREYSPNEKMPRLRGPAPKLMNLGGDYTFFPATGERGYFHSHDHTYIRDGVDYQFWKDLSPEVGYTILEHRVPEEVFKVYKDIGGLRCTGEQVICKLGHFSGNRDEVYDRAFAAGEPRVAKGPVSGWTSWYYHYTDIDESVILKNLEAFGDRRISIDYFQVDDGWQQAIGDWEANEKFPQGMQHIAKRVHDYGYEAGLWVAPFIVDQKSAVFRDHKDWLVTFDGESFMPGGYNPGWGGALKGYYYVLDIYKEEVREYLAKVFDRVLNEWGFDLVKLDFLYAVAIYPREGKSRGMIMADAMDLLREWCGDKKILGCGVPLASAFNKVEYCRIGSDVGPSWDMRSFAILNLRERISTRNSLHSTIARRGLSRRKFLNDPDVFMLRKENCRLNDEQKHSLYLINLALGDLVFTSDDLTNYDAATMRKYQSQFPHFYKETHSIFQVGEIYTIRFSCQNLDYVLISNLSGRKDDYELPKGVYYNEDSGLIKGGKVLFKPFQSRVFLHVKDDDQLVLGSNGHLFPGLDVESVKWKNGELSLIRHPLALSDGEILVRVPDDSGTTVLNKGTQKNVEEVHGIRFIKAY